MLSFSVDSLVYIPAQVTAVKAGQPYNPTGDTVQMTFTPGVAISTPVSFTWYPASWDSAQGAYTALCLIGPGGTVTLTAGIWSVWTLITDNPESPVLLAGQINMY